jgi:hypothetical protein
MQSTTRNAAGVMGIALAVLLFVGGASALWYLPGFGLLIGPVLIVVSLVSVGLRRRQVWHCQKCGEYFDPTLSSSATRRGT